MTTITYDAFLEKEEFITAEEYLQRRARGEINPMKTDIVPPDLNTGSRGGVRVTRDQPRYRAAFEKEDTKNVF